MTADVANASSKWRIYLERWFSARWYYSTTLGRTPFTPQTQLYKCYCCCLSWAAWTITPLWGYPCRSGMSGVHFLVKYIAEYRAIFPRCVFTIRREVLQKYDVEHICFHSVRPIRDPSFGYPEHSNWQRGFWQCSNFTGFTHPTKQTNKQTYPLYTLY